MVAVYSRHSKFVTTSFAQGAKCKCIPVEEYEKGPVAIYGLARGLLGVLQKAPESIRMDHGYIGRDYYSVTKNVIQHTGVGEYDSKRLDPIRPELKPMRHGEHVLLFPPSRALCEFIDVDTDDWIEKYQNLSTDRPIRVREKGDSKPLNEDLKDCHAVVTYNSKAAIKAATEGVSVFATDPCCVSAISGRLEDIDSPDLNIDRESWLRALSYNQFTLIEMRRGFR